MTETEFRNEYQGTFWSEPNLLRTLAAEYHQRCDAFDETVVVGGVPRNRAQQFAMSVHARGVRDELFSRLTNEQQHDLQREIISYH